MTKRQLSESRGEWTEAERLREGIQLPRRRGDRQLYEEIPISVALSLRLSAVHVPCTVVRADIEKPTIFLTWGTNKGKLDKQQMLKQVGDSHRGKGTGRF